MDYSAQTMDPHVKVMYTVPKGRFVNRTKLQVKLSSDYNRKTLPPEYESTIDGIWEERKKKNPKLWNGTKFRIESVEQDRTNPVFNIGITDYKDFICTNWSPNAKLYHELGSQYFNNTQAYMSDALGVGSLVETSDHCMILLRRSIHVGEAVGLWDIPGGHPEPEELVGKIETSQINLDDMSTEAVVDEIFNSTLREIADEVNVPIGTLTDPELIGIARNTTSAGRPSSEYYVSCSLDSAEIKIRYQEGNQAEAEETTNIMLVPMADVLELQSKDLWKDMAPSAKGCVVLYQIAMANRKKER